MPDSGLPFSARTHSSDSVAPATPNQGVIQNEYDNRADDRNQQAPGIESGYANAAKCVEDETSNNVG